MACKEAKEFDKCVASPMAMKHDQHYIKMMGFVRAWMSLAVIHSNTLVFHGTRVGRAFGPDIMDGAAFSATEGVREW